MTEPEQRDTELEGEKMKVEAGKLKEGKAWWGLTTGGLGDAREGSSAENASGLRGLVITWKVGDWIYINCHSLG